MADFEEASVAAFCRVDVTVTGLAAGFILLTPESNVFTNWYFFLLPFHVVIFGPSFSCLAFSCLAFSCPAISCPAILMVRHFHVLHFHSTQ